MLACTKCGAELGGANVNVQQMVATCPGCNSVFRFTADDLNPGAEHVPGGTPARFRLEEARGGWAVSWPWRRWHYLFLIFFAIAWDGFLVFWYWMGAASDHAPWIVFVFPIGHVAVGVFLTYFVAAAMLNRTTVSVDAGWLTLAHRPLPWFGSRRAALSEVRELTVRANRSSESTHVDYALVCVIGGKQRRLAGGLEEHEADWLLHHLRRLRK